jgi:adenine-specific DNA-methyltransferase
MSGARARLGAGEWERKFGYRAVTLYAGQPDRHVLLNGPQGGICLDTTSEEIPQDARALAWSSDSLHYVHVGDADVAIARPGRPDLERIPTHIVTERLDLFESRLEEDESYSFESVVTRATALIPMLKAYFREDVEGVRSVRAYLALLAARIEGATKVEVPQIPWIEPDVASVAAEISEAVWDDLSRQFDMKWAGLNIDMQLLLRHTAGKVFQEAHYLTLLSPQLALDVGAPLAARTSKAPARRGIFFTPASLARTVVEQALRAAPKTDKRELRVFDPACGSGEFLKEFARQFHGIADGRTLHLIGCDVSPVAVDMARFLVANEKRSTPGLRMTSEIAQTDSLASAWPADIDFVVMNPPFVSTTDLSSEQRNVLVQRYAHVAQGRADLSFAFVFEAIRSLNDHSVLATLIPASVLDSRSAAALRSAIEQRGTPQVIAHFGSQGMFSNATVDTAMLVAALERRTDSTIYAWSNHEVSASSKALRALRSDEMYDIAYDDFNVYRRPFAEGGWTPRSLKAEYQVRQYAEAPTLKETFQIDQGVLTGRNKTLILTNAQVDELPPREQRYFVSAVMNRSIYNGVLRPAFKVFFPYGELQIASEAALRDAVPEYFKKWLEPDLVDMKARKDRQSVLLERWWELSRNVKPLGEPKIISTYFGAPGKFAFDQAGEWVAVQGYTYGLKDVSARSDERIWFASLAILNSEFFETMVAAVSQRVAGGQFNLSKRYVGSLPFPNFNDIRVQEPMDRLALAGESIHKGDSMSLLKLEDDVRKVYAPWRSSE